MKERGNYPLIFLLITISSKNIVGVVFILDIRRGVKFYQTWSKNLKVSRNFVIALGFTSYKTIASAMAPYQCVCRGGGLGSSVVSLDPENYLFIAFLAHYFGKCCFIKGQKNRFFFRKKNQKFRKIFPKLDKNRLIYCF